MSSGPPTVISVQDLGKRYILGATHKHRTLRDTLAMLPRAILETRDRPSTEELWALRQVSFDVARGEVVGIIGRNGAGKSTLLKILSQITEPTEGRVILQGRVASLLEVGTGFHPELSGRENIFLNGAILGMRRAEIRAKFDEIVQFAEVTRFLDTPIKRYSSGMYVRLAFAVAAHLEPEILVVDEVLAVGDTAFQRKCLGKMKEVSRSGRTVLFVSHNMGAVRRLTQRSVLLEGGRVQFIGATGDCIARYMASITPETGAHRIFTDGRTDQERPVTVRSLTLVTPDGSPGTVFELDRPWVLEAELESVPRGAPFQASLIVRSEFGVALHHLVCRDSGHDEFRLDGRGTLRICLPRLKLYPGRYTVDFWIGHPGWASITMEHREGAITFQVEQGSAIACGRPLSSAKGAVHTEAEWSLLEEVR